MSTDSSDQLESYKAQVAYYTDAIAKNPKWRFAGIYADEGLSGTQAAKRDDFLRMIKDCEKGKIDYIITKSVSGKYPFSDLLVCDSCGNRYRRCMWISGGKKKIVWRCITRIEHGGKACESISVGDELIHKAVYRSINGYIQNNSGALDIVLSELSKQFGGNDYTDDLCNIERSINELNKQMEDAAMIEVTTQGNKERIREEIIELSQRIVALRNEKSIIEEKMATAKTRNEELSMFSKELSLYNADCSEITDNKLRRIIQEVRIKKDHTIVIELKNGMLLEEAL